MIKKLGLNSEFTKNVAVLMTGTVIAQALGILFAPIIHRYYGPTETAELDLFTRIVAVIAAVATLRYELALPITKTDSHSFRLYHVALRSAFIVSVLVFIVVFILAIRFQSFDQMFFYLGIPIAVFFIAFNNIGTNWAIRNKLFRHISIARLTNSVSSNITKVILGLFGFGPVGLILGLLVGAILSTVSFAFDFLSAKNKFKINSKSPRNYLLAKEYDEFPKVNLPHVLMDLGRDLLVAILILDLFSKEDFGLYGLSFRMLKVPLIFIGVALGQALFQKCAEKINNREDVIPILTKTVKTLFLFSIPPFTLIFFFGEEIFVFVFGEEWRGAGQYSEILAPWFMMNFIASPISGLPIILRKQKQFFIIALIGTVTLLLSLYIPPALLNYDIKSTLMVVSYLQALYLIIAIGLIFSYAKKAEVVRKD